MMPQSLISLERRWATKPRSRAYYYQAGCLFLAVKSRVRKTRFVIRSGLGYFHSIAIRYMVRYG